MAKKPKKNGGGSFLGIGKKRKEREAAEKAAAEKAARDKAKRDKARRDKAKRDKAARDKAKLDKAKLEKAQLERINLGQAEIGQIKDRPQFSVGRPGDREAVFQPGQVTKLPAGFKLRDDGAFEVKRVGPVNLVARPPTKLPPILPDRPVLDAADWNIAAGGGSAKAELDKARKKIDSLRTDIPLLLMPVRMETRFAGKSLRIRIFPDQIALDGLERRLTEAEVAAGKGFLEQYRKAHKDEYAALWEAYAGSGDPWRSAWIIRCLQNGKYETRAEGEADSPATAPLLPEKWLVTGRRGKDTFHALGEPIPRNLAFSPNLAADFDAKGDLAIDPAVKWMFDFAEAEANGMALTMTLPASAQNHIDELFVTGIAAQDPAGKGKLKPERAADLLDQLFEAQMYDWGAGFVPTGTATNNTSEVKSAWSAAKPDLEALRLREMADGGKYLSVPDLEDDGDEALRPVGVLAAKTGADTARMSAVRALGLKANGALRRFEHRQGNERAAARAMNRLLWPVTMGEMFGTLLSGPDKNVFSASTIKYLRTAFCEHMTGGSPLPALRSGNTPYGLLPVESFTRRAGEKRHSDAAAQKRQMLSVHLRGLLPEWEAAIPKLLRLAERPVGMSAYQEPGDRLIGMMQQDPNPATFFASGARNLRGVPQFFYDWGERQVHPKHNPPHVETAFSRNRAARFKVTGELKATRPFSQRATTDFFFNQYELLTELWAAAGYKDYRDWPAKFRDGEHQREVLTDKIDMLELMLNAKSGLYQKVAENSFVKNAQIKDVQLYSVLASPYRTQIEAIISALKGMRDLVEDHLKDSATFKLALDPPPNLYKGVVGDQDIDPRLTWLTYKDLVPWPAEQLVEVDKGPQTVRLATYMDEIAAYAQHFIDGSPAPALTNFPKGQKPMLYQLLRDSVFRTATAADPVSSAVNVALDGQKLAAGGKAVLEPRQIGETLRRVKDVGFTRQGAKLKRTEIAMAHTIAARSPAELRNLSKQLKDDAKREAKNKDYPAADAKALAAEFDRIAKLPAGAVASKIPQTGDKERLARLTELKAAIELIGQLNPAQASLLMRQTMGLASWRLDAWFTGITSARITALRFDNQPTREGIQVGAFGWTEDLRRNPAKSEKAHSTRSQGFIHTPSLTHAKTAAILRSGWNSYGSDKQDSPLAVDLSSERMRFAQWAFDAIRTGQDPGDIFGREFERALRHKEGAQAWIWPIRQAVLELDKAKGDPNLPVVDGLDLKRLWTDQRKKLEEAARLHLADVGGKKTASFAPVVRAFAVMEDRIDALADAGLADAMFALVQGNPDRAGAQLSAISDGIRAPADLQMLSTTPGAQTQTQRVVLLAPTGESGIAPWVDPASGDCALAAADPEAEAIAAGLLGPAEQLSFRYLASAADGSKIAQGQIHWGELIAAKSPFAGGALAALRALPGDGWSDESSMGLRLRGFLLDRSPELSTASQIQWRPEGNAEATLERCSAWRAVIAGSRPLHPRDCGEDNPGGEAQIDLGGLESRAGNAETAFRLAAKAVLRLLPEPVEGDPEPVGTAKASKISAALTALAAAGWDKAVKSAQPDGAAIDDLYARAWSLAPGLREAMNALSQITPRPGKPDAETDALLRAARARLKVIFGGGVPGIARFVPADEAGVAQAITQAGRRKDPPGMAYQWLEQMAYVREPLRRINDAMVLTACDPGAPQLADPQIAQWPDGASHPWIAVSAPKGREGPSGSWLFLSPGQASNKVGHSALGIAGLVVDEVIDKVPSTQVNTGAAMHFDAPNCEAPQTMLLALPPEGESWSHEVLLDTLKDCFTMARMRAVDSTVMDDFNAVLPGIFGGAALSPGGTNGEK